MPSGPSNLENLARAKQLNAEPPRRREIEVLLKRARGQLADARNSQLASAGHRKVIFQTLDATLGAPPELWVALDRYHDKRNRHEYEAADVSILEAEDLIKLAAELEMLVIKRISK